ncbi:MAG: RluA family pseudouridine synthase [Desulfobacterales bacterium]|nr:RluA family pseudouridine synthase [Desulfobacterales bacterium]
MNPDSQFNGQLTAKIILKQSVGSNDPKTFCDFLAVETSLSKSKIKKAMIKGAAWLRKKGGKRKRIRRAALAVKTGDYLEFYYDEKLLAQTAPQGKCLYDYRHYSLWYKPSGLMSQGTLYGDHCSLLRQAEVYFKPPRKVFLVHRLDREAAGLMILVHSKIAAAKFSDLFKKNQIVKQYRIDVRGNLTQYQRSGMITLPLEGKTAITEFEVEAFNPRKNISTVDVGIKTGRLHQIRRHFEMIGFPVMGDPKYGQGNKNTEGMKLVATALRFRCPFSRKEMVFEL